MICKHCNKEISDSYTFCIYCGNKIESDDIDKTVESIKTLQSEADTEPESIEAPASETALTKEPNEPSFEGNSAYEPSHFEEAKRTESDNNQYEQKDRSAVAVWVLLGILLVCIIVLVITAVSLSEKAKAEQIKENGLVWDAQSAAAIANEYLDSSDFDYASYKITYDTGWVRVIDYKSYEDIVYSIEETWYGNTSGWAKQNIDWQIEELHTWADPYEDYSFFEYEIVQDGNDIRAYYTVNDMNLLENSKDFKKGWLFPRTKDGFLISMASTEKTLLESGYSKQ